MVALNVLKIILVVALYLVVGGVEFSVEFSVNDCSHILGCLNNNTGWRTNATIRRCVLLNLLGHKKGRPTDRPADQRSDKSSY